MRVKLLRLLFRRSRLVILLAAALSLVSAHFATKLYGNLKPDLEELLPRRNPLALTQYGAWRC